MDDIDTDRIDDAVLALLWLGRHEGRRAWKGFDWDAMVLLHQKGLISDPVGKAKSVAFSDEGLERAERLFSELFSRGPDLVASSSPPATDPGKRRSSAGPGGGA